MYERQGEMSFWLRESLSFLRKGEDSGLLDAPYLRLFYNLEELLGAVIHDGRNRLGPIKGYASLMSSKVAPGSQEAQWSNRIIENVEMMERQLDLFSIYRMKGASLVTETDCREILEDAICTLRLILGNSIRIKVTNKVRGKHSLHGEILKRVLVHILRNACESTNRGGSIAISASVEPVIRTAQGAVTAILLKIMDRGTGIAESKKSFIWKPFYSTKPSHFGLGLTYVSMAASILGARVSLESKEGFGTAVSFSIQPGGGEVEIPKVAGR